MKKYIFLILVLGFIYNGKALAQLSIAPTNLFIDSNTRFGTYMVINGSNKAQEVSIEFFFGYSDSDENGNRVLVDDDSVNAARYSIADKIRAFPQNFTLAPNQRQIVRLRVNAENNIPDGTYWARIRTASSPETPPLELQATDVVSARLGITIEQVTGIFYKKGQLSTGIEIQQIRTDLQEDTNILVVRSEYLKTGNSPFLGTITTTLVNASGSVVREGSVSTSVYFDGVHKQELSLEDIPSGNYTVNVSFETSRTDVSAADLIQMPKVTESTSYIIR
tara:strand:- start:24498 stop:25331 length:834 start_codon:yes stop_codon:yes gene_type:complete